MWFPMIAKREYEGEWWFPKLPEKKFQGTLTFTPEEGCSLNVLVFETTNEMPEEKIDLILGASADGKKTLYKCLVANKRTHWTNDGINTENITFNVRFIFVGTHFDSTDQIKFNEMSARYAYLDEWVNVSGFKIKHPIKGKAFEIKYKRPKAIQFNVDKNLAIKVGFEVTYPTLSKPQIEASIEQHAQVFFYPSIPATVEEFIERFFTMQNFSDVSSFRADFPDSD